jgi:hypothetical protein
MDGPVDKNRRNNEKCESLILAHGFARTAGVTCFFRHVNTFGGCQSASGGAPSGYRYDNPFVA